MSSPYEYRVYVKKQRWNSFWHQIDEIIENNPKNILEIGTGSNVVKTLLKQVINMNYTNIDISADLNPDIVGSVLDLPFEDENFDNILCCQVLEHLPFDDFEKALSEIFRVAKKKVVISLPNCEKIKQSETIINGKKHRFIDLEEVKENSMICPDDHEWEINAPGYALLMINSFLTLASNKYGFKQQNEYRVWELPYHHFFIFEKE